MDYVRHGEIQGRYLALYFTMSDTVHIYSDKFTHDMVHGFTLEKIDFRV